ncbi:MAG TPA: type II toxin-antitoxin system VapC family toxin [Firmicutes bacterium]|nr:type II toxin-antitoxin system VapC family toxin [Bacillota bacterium]
MESVVVDASVALSWVLPGEDIQHVIELRDRAANKPNISLLVSPTFWYEVVNALWVAARRQRISPGIAGEALSVLRDFLFEELNPDPVECLNTALQHEISVYDAVYLQIAMKTGSPLWTVDRLLVRASEQLSIRAEPLRPA